MSFYKNVFKQALKLTWNNKLFWFLGVFTVFFSTSVEIEMVDNFLGPNRSYLYTFKDILQNSVFKKGLIESLQSLMNTKLFGVMLGLGLILLVLVVISVIAQILITAQSSALIKVGSPDLKGHKGINWLDSLSKNKKLIIPVALLDLFLKIMVNLFLVVISLPLLLGNQSSSTDWMYVVFFIVLFPMAIITAFVVRYMTCYLIIYGYPIKEAIRNGWKLFIKNWLVSAEMSLVLFLTNIVGSLLIVFIILAVANPLWFAGILVQQYVFKGGFYIILALSYIIYFALFAWGASLLSVFNITSWTSLFLQLDKLGGESKISRVVANVIKK
jgi:hypothetical protein